MSRKTTWIAAGFIAMAIGISSWLSYYVYDECRMTNTVLYCVRMVVR